MVTQKIQEMKKPTKIPPLEQKLPWLRHIFQFSKSRLVFFHGSPSRNGRCTTRVDSTLDGFKQSLWISRLYQITSMPSSCHLRQGDKRQRAKHCKTWNPTDWIPTSNALENWLSWLVIYFFTQKYWNILSFPTSHVFRLTMVKHHRQYTPACSMIPWSNWTFRGSSKSSQEATANIKASVNLPRSKRAFVVTRRNRFLLWKKKRWTSLTPSKLQRTLRAHPNPSLRELWKESLV